VIVTPGTMANLIGVRRYEEPQVCCDRRLRVARGGRAVGV
jgi:hypothetical protein